MIPLALLTMACDSAPEPDSGVSPREVYFDGAEIKAELETHPDTVFFVDARGGTVNHFDQSEEPIDFSNFLFQCPSMQAPIAMDEYLEEFDADFSANEHWSIASDQGSETRFRREAQTFMECEIWCPLGPDDCVLICSEPV